MVLFILFPGTGNSKNLWNEIHDFKKSIKIDFLKELKKLGDVYIFTPNIYKIPYYIKYNKNRQKLEDKIYNEKPNNLDINDININSICEKVYNEVKSYNGHFIPIGHSAGGWFAINFVNMYPERCKKIILIESIKLLFNPPERNINKIYEHINQNKLNNINNEIKKGDEKYINNFLDFTVLRFLKSMKKVNKKLNIPILSFENIRITNNLESDNKNNMKILNAENKMIKLNKNKITFIHFCNSGHFPWYISRYSDEMIKQIKCFVE